MSNSCWYLLLEGPRLTHLTPEAKLLQALQQESNPSLRDEQTQCIGLFEEFNFLTQVHRHPTALSWLRVDAQQPLGELNEVEFA